MKNPPPESPPPVPSIFRELWTSITEALSTPAPPPTQPEVILHDPHSSDPHDLDDPFFERKIQERIGETIANAAQHKAKP